MRGSSLSMSLKMIKRRCVNIVFFTIATAGMVAGSEITKTWVTHYDQNDDGESSNAVFDLPLELEQTSISALSSKAVNQNPQQRHWKDAENSSIPEPRATKKEEVTRSSKKENEGKESKKGCEYGASSSSISRKGAKHSKKGSGKGKGGCSPIDTSAPSSSQPDIPTLAPRDTAVPTIAPDTPNPTIAETTLQPTQSAPSTVAPSVEGECSPVAAICCEDIECPGGSVCEGRNCVIEGSLHFTLSWFGSNDLNIGVLAPGASNPINAPDPFDPVTGGRLQQDMIPNSAGYWTENIYFPIDQNVINGSYVIQIDTREVDRIMPPTEDEWSITLNREGKRVAEVSGNEFNKVFHIFVDNPPKACDTEVDQCCSSSECPPFQVCEARTCVEQGQPRFTLSWYGSDDKDIIVTTPSGADIFYDNAFDPISGGRLQKDVVPVPEEVGFYSENVYFPRDGLAPPGVYQYIVRAGGDEPWSVTVALNYTIVEHSTGVGDDMLVYEFGNIAPTVSPSPTATQTVLTPDPTFVEIPCTPNDSECCESEDCPSSIGSQSCANRNCVTDGLPRFSLKWTGSGDMDLRVRAPGGALIFFENPFDPVSGGVLEEDVVPTGFGYWTENIYFPEGPEGTYIYGVSGSNKEWELDIYLGDELVDRKRGTGASAEFLFFYGDCDEGASCCTSEECGNDSVCTNQNCATQGNLRFSLSWDGLNDKEIFVITPEGTLIGHESPVDGVTGGTLEADVQPEEEGRWIENIYFPIDRDLVPGMYQYQVNSGGFEVWSIEVYLGGELITAHSGLTDSSLFSLEVAASR